MENREYTWIAVVDDSQGRLLRARSIPSGPGWRLRLELIETVENPLRELDLGAAPEQEGWDPRSVGSRNAELHARYAAEIAKWLSGHMQKGERSELEIFAPLRLLTLLRTMIPVTQRGQVNEHSAKLEGASVRFLERHPALVEAVRARLGQGKRAS